MIGRILTASLVTFSAALAFSPGWKPSRRQVAMVEARIVMPQGADGPLTTYTRYHAGIVVNGHHVISGELFRLTIAPAEPNDIRIVSESAMPAFADGGCGVIYFTFDLDQSVLSKLNCNYDLLPPPLAPATKR